MLKLLYTSTTKVSTDAFSLSFNDTGKFWDPNFDAITGFEGTNYFRIFRDGTTIQLGRYWWNGAGPAIDFAPADGGVVWTWAGISYFSDPKTSLINWNKVFDTGALGAALGGGLFLRNPTGVMKYYQDSPGSVTRFDVVTGAQEGIINFAGSGVGVQLVGGQIIMTATLGGTVQLIDLTIDSLILDSSVPPFRAAALDTEFQNLMTIEADGTLKIWDLAIEPQTIQNPILDPPTVVRYNGVDISVIVEGSNGEPVPDVPVAWEVTTINEFANTMNQTGVNEGEVNEGSFLTPAKGIILPLVSVTGNDGVATATYCPPGLDWEIGDRELLTAKVFK